MELQLFIKETLTQITKGLKDAQMELKDSDFYINPLSYNGTGAAAVNKQNSVTTLR
jgi:hypothetical protein